MPDEDESPDPPKRLMPSNSTFIGTGGGAALAPVLVWLFGTFTHVQMPAEVAAGLGAIIGNVLGYFFEGGRRQ